MKATIKKYFHLTVLLLLCFFVISCNRDQLTNPGSPFIESTVGVYVLSEGGFSQGTSKLSFYSVENDSFYVDIFHPGSLGLFTSGMILYNNYLYILEQGNYGAPGKIYKADTTGKVVNSQLTGINPYSLTITNNKIYITNGPASDVGVLNLADLSLIKYISVGAFPQEIISFGNYVFVCNTSFYGGTQDSSISVIDANSDNVVSTIWLHKDPSSLGITNDNKILAGCPGSNGMIFIIDPTTLKKTDSLTLTEGFGKDLSVDMQSNNVYFISNLNNIVKLNLSDRSNTTIITNQNPSLAFFYGYKFDSKNRKHYICDARNFQSNGNFMILNMDNYLEKNFSAGIAPRRLVLKSN